MKNLSLIGLVVLAAIACSCGSSNTIQEHTHHTRFSKADSLTDAYLVLSDSLLLSWNRIVSTEVDKSRTLQELIDDLDHAHLLTEELRETFDVRIDQLEKIRFTQENIDESQVVQDYDLAFQAIVEDVSKLTKSPGAPDTEAMFKYLRQSAVANRKLYDSLARSFNDFVQKNKTALEDIQTGKELEAKPVFVKIK